MPEVKAIPSDNLPDNRMRLIEALLLWEGEVTNERLRNLLGVSSVHASRLLGRFQEEHPSQIERAHGQGRGRYRPRRGITPQLNVDTAEAYLALIAEHHSPHIEAVRTDYTRCPPTVFGALHRAAQAGTGLRLTYHSLSRPDGVSRIIYPHTLVQLGTRWHARAWDTDRSAFRDFNLGRISEYQPLAEKAPVPAIADEAWHTIVGVRLCAHHGLTDDQARVIKWEYFDGAHDRRIPARACLVHYLIQGLRAAIDAAQQPPAYLLEVSNLDEVRPWLMLRTLEALS